MGDTTREASSHEVVDLKKENEHLKQLVAEIAFQIYHPIAKLRYKYKFFRFPVKSYILHTNKD
jgi:hypothetical protein